MGIRKRKNNQIDIDDSYNLHQSTYHFRDLQPEQTTRVRKVQRINGKITTYNILKRENVVIPGVKLLGTSKSLWYGPTWL